MIEPSDQERAELPECTARYLQELKAENQILKNIINEHSGCMKITEYISLDALAASLKLPRTYLKRLSDKGKIPCLWAGGRRRFNPVAVQSALDKLADQKTQRLQHEESEE